MLVLLANVLAAVVGTFSGHARPATGPCYVVVTAIVSSADPYTIQRVVTTGIRRYDDTGSGSPSYCTPFDDTRVSRAMNAVDARLRESATTGSVEHVVVRTTLPDVAANHVVQIVAKARATAREFRGVEVVSVANARGIEQETIPMPALSRDAAARAECATENTVLQRAGASFLWAC